MNFTDSILGFHIGDLIRPNSSFAYIYPCDLDGISLDPIHPQSDNLTMILLDFMEFDSAPFAKVLTSNGTICCIELCSLAKVS